MKRLEPWYTEAIEKSSGEKGREEEGREEREIGRQGGREEEAERKRQRGRGREKPRNTGVCPMFGTGRKKSPRRTFGHNGSTIKVQARALADTETTARKAFS